MFVAATADGRTDRDLVIKDIIEKERETRWKPAGATDGDLALVALATMCGGASRSAFEHRSARIDAALAQFSLPRYQAITGKSARSLLAPLEPNLLGEWLVLESFADLDDLETSATFTAAWAANVKGTYGFILRSIRDFPEHEMIPGVIKPPSSTIISMLRHRTILVTLSAWQAMTSSTRWSAPVRSSRATQHGIIPKYGPLLSDCAAGRA
jgi:hypothetical protein